MAGTTADDWDGDLHRHSSRVHYRLYRNDVGEPVVICVQWFDYPALDARRILSPEAWDNEEDALAAATVHASARKGVDLTGLPPGQAFALGEMTAELIQAAEERGYQRGLAESVRAAVGDVAST